MKQKYMDKVKIKRVKRNKKNVTAKEKILAGLGVGGALAGGGLGAMPKTNQTQMVRTQSGEQQAKKSKVTESIKKIFKQAYEGTVGVPEAKANVASKVSLAPGDNMMGQINNQNWWDEGGGGGSFNDFSADAQAQQWEASVQASPNLQTGQDPTATAGEAETGSGTETPATPASSTDDGTGQPDIYNLPVNPSPVDLNYLGPTDQAPPASDTNPIDINNLPVNPNPIDLNAGLGDGGQVSGGTETVPYGGTIETPSESGGTLETGGESIPQSAPAGETVPVSLPNNTVNDQLVDYFANQNNQPISPVIVNQPTVNQGWDAGQGNTGVSYTGPTQTEETQTLPQVNPDNTSNDQPADYVGNETVSPISSPVQPSTADLYNLPVTPNPVNLYQSQISPTTPLAQPDNTVNDQPADYVGSNSTVTNQPTVNQGWDAGQGSTGVNYTGQTQTEEPQPYNTATGASVTVTEKFVPVEPIPSTLSTSLNNTGATSANIITPNLSNPSSSQQASTEIITDAPPVLESSGVSNAVLPDLTTLFGMQQTQATASAGSKTDAATEVITDEPPVLDNQGFGKVDTIGVINNVTNPVAPLEQTDVTAEQQDSFTHYADAKLFTPPAAASGTVTQETINLAPPVINFSADNNKPAIQSLPQVASGVFYMQVMKDGAAVNNQFLGSDGKTYTQDTQGNYVQAKTGIFGKIAGTVQSGVGSVKNTVSTGTNTVKTKTGIGTDGNTFSGTVTKSTDPNLPTVILKDENKTPLYTISKGVYADPNGNLYVQPNGKGSSFVYSGIDITQLDSSTIQNNSAGLLGPGGQLLTAVGDGAYKDSGGNIYTRDDAGNTVPTGLKIGTSGSVDGLQFTNLLKTDDKTIDTSLKGDLKAGGTSAVKGVGLGTVGVIGGGIFGIGKNVLTNVQGAIIKWATNQKNINVPGQITFTDANKNTVTWDKFVVQMMLQDPAAGKEFITNVVKGPAKTATP
jgi:hypothetical protein